MLPERLRRAEGAYAAFLRYIARLNFKNFAANTPFALIAHPNRAEQVSAKYPCRDAAKQNFKPQNPLKIIETQASFAVVRDLALEKVALLIVKFRKIIDPFYRMFRAVSLLKPDGKQALIDQVVDVFFNDVVRKAHDLVIRDVFAPIDLQVSRRLEHLVNFIHVALVKQIGALLADGIYHVLK